MKNKVSLSVILLTAIGLMPAVANTTTYTKSSGDVSTTVTVSKVKYTSYQRPKANLYYTGENNKNTELYTRYEKPESPRLNLEKPKYGNNDNHEVYLLSPFFQPKKGEFGSVTDISYVNSGYDLVLNTPTIPGFDGLEATWDSSTFYIKEDLSYGITDNFALMLSAKLDAAEYTMDWATEPDDSMSDTKLASYGIGALWQFVDNYEWVGTVSGYYQRYTDLGDFFTFDAKAGYKIENHTIYGLARATAVTFDGDNYGNGFEEDGKGFFIAYKRGDQTSVFLEAGLGVFTQLNQDWTLNVEAVLGDYDWSSQGNFRAAIGWQPTDRFALSFYGKGQFYNTADDMELEFYWYEPSAGLNTYTQIGTTTIDNNSEMSFGLQGVLTF